LKAELNEVLEQWIYVLSKDILQMEGSLSYKKEYYLTLLEMKYTEDLKVDNVKKTIYDGTEGLLNEVSDIKSDSKNKG